MKDEEMKNLGVSQFCYYKSDKQNNRRQTCGKQLVDRKYERESER